MKEPFTRKMIATRTKHTIALSQNAISAGPGYFPADDYEELDLNVLASGGRPDCVAFHVDGDSAVPRVHPGSVVVVDPHQEPKRGDIIAVCLNGLCCVKVYDPAPKLRLVSANPDYDPIEIREGDRLDVLGVVVSQWAPVKSGRTEMPVCDITDVRRHPTGLYQVEYEADNGCRFEVFLTRDTVRRGIAMGFRALRKAVRGALHIAPVFLSFQVLAELI